MMDNLVDLNSLPQIGKHKRHTVDDEISKVLDALPQDHKALALGQAIYRCKAIEWERRWRVARECLKYESPSLGVVAQVDGTDFASILDRRLERIEQQMKQEQTKLIENKPTTTDNGGTKVKEAEVKPNRGAVDRKWRRV